MASAVRTGTIWCTLNTATGIGLSELSRPPDATVPAKHSPVTTMAVHSAALKRDHPVPLVDGYEEKYPRRQRDQLVERRDAHIERPPSPAQPDTRQKDQEKEQSRDDGSYGSAHINSFDLERARQGPAALQQFRRHQNYVSNDLAAFQQFIGLGCFQDGKLFHDDRFDFALLLATRRA